MGRVLTADQPKRCLYCLRPFFGRGRCCSDWCSRRVNGKVVWITRSRNQAVTDLMEALQRKVRFVPQWRRAAMGEPADLLTIFGAEPHPDGPRHGDTLDGPGTAQAPEAR